MNMNERRDDVLLRLDEIHTKWSWANKSVSQTARDAIDLIQYMQQRIIDLEAMTVARELYKGEG